MQYWSRCTRAGSGPVRARGDSCLARACFCAGSAALELKHVITFPLVSRGCRPTCAQVETRDSGETEKEAKCCQKLPQYCHFFPMADEPLKSLKPQLVIALAQGKTVAAWARGSDVPLRTAYRWSKDPKVRKAIDAFRCRSIGQSGCCLEKPPGRSAGSPGSRIVPSRSRCA